MFRERQQIAISVLAVVLVGGFVVLRYLPLRRQIKDISRQKTAEVLALRKGQTEREQLPLLREQLESLRLAVGNYEMSIPEHRSVGLFLRKIADLMNEFGLQDQAVTPGEEIVVNNLHCIPVQMKCTGRLSELFEFHKRLQGLDRLVRIENVTLVNNAELSGEIHMDIKTVIYYRAEAAGTKTAGRLDMPGAARTMQSFRQAEAVTL